MNLTIIKKIAKQGRNKVLIIPKNLHPYIKEGELVRVQISTMPAQKKEEQV